MASPSNDAKAADRSSDASKADDAMEAMEKQIAQLRREIGKINRTLAERLEDAAEDATGWYETATDRASRAATALRAQAQGVSGVVKENPGTVSSALLIGGLVGLMVGLVLNQPMSRHQSWFDRG